MPDLDNHFPEVEGTHRPLPEVDFGIGNPFGTIRGTTRDQEESQSRQEEDFTGGHTLEVTFGTIRKPIPLPGG